MAHNCALTADQFNANLRRIDFPRCDPLPPGGIKIGIHEKDCIIHDSMDVRSRTVHSPKEGLPHAPPSPPRNEYPRP